jgi:drug/metabolite transporter (DMT)-like permease
VLAPFLALGIAAEGLSAGTDAWLCFAYVTLFSMFLGFFAWYRGLAEGGVARIGQIQLAQPVLTLVWAAILLGEEITAATVAAALAVLASVGATQRTRVRVRRPTRRSA